MNQRPQAPLSDLLGVVDPLEVRVPADPLIRRIASDSRDVEPGALYVAIPGSRTDGHRYIAEAVRNGARAVVCERPPCPAPEVPVVRVADSRRAVSALADRFYGSPSRYLRVAGVTGTDGKTSTTELLRAVLNEAGRTAGSIGTLGNYYDGRRVDTPLTTPDPVSLHGTFQRMRRVGLSDACMEVSSHSLVQHRVADVDFDVAVLTNITHDHLDLHGTLENYVSAKRRLFEQLAHDSVAVLPADSRYCRDFQAATPAEVLTYGMDSLCDVKGTITSMAMDGMEIAVRTPFESYCVRTGLIGAFNCLNILAAATAAFAYGIGGEVVKEAMRGFQGVPGRLERVSVPGRQDVPGLCVDFAHTPEALQKVLGTLGPLVPGRLVCVVGCGGDRDRRKRPLMGRIAATLADCAVFTADNSRSERTTDILAQMMEGVPSEAGNVLVRPDRRAAIKLALELAETPDAMVAVCGRGCEKYLKTGDEKIPFDDRVVARELMNRMVARRRKSA
ncbi:MAG: UDP-N-acetylmuramoyl-L-alanyl-D-glutamate--2,6-diaminopimelate ligase [Planctomycetota bacterium]